MERLLKEILEIPQRAEMCYAKNQGIQLPLQVPYLGMGASYYAPLTLLYCGKDINPQMASEYYYYLSEGVKPLGVLISQSGESSETVWNLERFEYVVSITNNPESSLAKSEKTKEVFEMYGGQEEFSTNKTYINTLIILYLGLGIDPREGIEVLKKNFDTFRERAKSRAKEISDYLNSVPVNGLFVLGSGPNLATSQQGALVLSETTKLPWIGMSVAQYDHGPKETAKNSVVVMLNGNGKDSKRIEQITRTLKSKSNALVVELAETKLRELFTPLTLITQLNFLMSYLVEILGIQEGGWIGEKVTKVSDEAK